MINEKNKMHSHKNNIKVSTISNKLNNAIHDATYVKKTSFDDNINKKKIAIKNKTKFNSISTSSSNSSNHSSNTLICKNNKSSLQSKKDFIFDNNNITSFKNQNSNSHTSKTFNINTKLSSLSDILDSKIESACTQNTSTAQIPAFNNILRGGVNNFCYTFVNQIPIENVEFYNSYATNQSLSYDPNQCSQQIHFQNLNSNSNQCLKNHNRNSYISNTDSNCAIPTFNQHNRLKVHQNYHNLTYIETNKEQSINQNISEIKPRKSAESKVNNTVTNNKIVDIKLADNKTKVLDIKLPSSNDFVEKSESKNTTLKLFKSITNNYESHLSQSSCTRNSSENVINTLNAPVFSNCTLTFPTENRFKSNINSFSLQQQIVPYLNAKPYCNALNMYSPICPQSEQNEFYCNDNPMLILTNKRIQKKHFHGRRHWFSTLRSLPIPDNTPADRFLAKSHLIKLKLNTENVINGSKWDKLSSDIWNKFLDYQQKESIYTKKIFLWKFLYLSLKRNFPRYGLYLVGSTITGFGTNYSDVDLCLTHKASFSIDSKFEAISHLNNIHNYLKTLGIFERFHLIEARIPILKFCDSNNSLEVDLNFNNSVGIRNTHLLYCYSQLDWRLRPLVIITKLWARYHNINNAKTMTISSYSLVLMVIHFLQYGVNPPILPCLHEMYPEKFNIILTTNAFGFVDIIEEIKPYKSENVKSLGELFILFLEYYSNFNYSKYAISVRTGKVLLIEECRNVQSLKNNIHQWKELCIEEPFELTNTARSVYDGETFHKIKNIFLMSCQVLSSTLDLNKLFLPLYYVQKNIENSL